MMRFFKRNADDKPLVTHGFVQDNIIYDSEGEVVFDPGATLDSSEDMEEQTDFGDNAVDTTSGFGSVDAETYAETNSIEQTNVEEPETLAQNDMDTSGPIVEFYDEALQIDLDEQTPSVDVTSVDATEPDLLHRRVNLGEIRMDVARITSDIQSGERLYQRAQQRVESLMGFVERAEVDFSLLNRLEPENRRLKARNRVLEAESESITHSERRLRNELDEALSQLEEARTDVEGQHAKVRALTSQLDRRDDELKTLTEEREEVAMRLERTQTSVEVESRENVLLREQISTLSTRMEEITAERMELAKIVESLKIDCDDYRAQKIQSQSEVTDLRVALATAQKVNGEMKTRMVSLHEEIKGFKTQYEFNVISRDDRITNLEARLSASTKQLRIKDDAAKSALRDVAQLRKARSTQDVERERLERIIENQQRQIEEANTQVKSSRASMAELDQRYNDVSEALTVHQRLLTPSGVAAPLSDPPPFQSTARKIDNDDQLTPENVEDLITDYKLGLRDKIA